MNPDEVGCVRSRKCSKTGCRVESAFSRSLERLEEFREELGRLHDGEIKTLRQENVSLQLRIEQDSLHIQDLQAELLKRDRSAGPIHRNSHVSVTSTSTSGGGGLVTDEPPTMPRRLSAPIDEGTCESSIDVAPAEEVATDTLGSAGAEACSSQIPTKTDELALEVLTPRSIESSESQQAGSCILPIEIKRPKKEATIGVCEAAGGRSATARDLGNWRHSASSHGGEAFHRNDLDSVRRSSTMPDFLSQANGTQRRASFPRSIVPSDPGNSEAPCARGNAAVFPRSSTSPVGLENIGPDEVRTRVSSKESQFPSFPDAIESDQRFQVLQFWVRDEVDRPSQSWESVSLGQVGSSITHRYNYSVDSIPYDETFYVWVAHPFSKKRIIWDTLCLIFVATDVIFVPLHFFGMPVNSITIIASWVSRIFWLLDVVASLFTGTYIKGILEMRPSKIVARYARTWLCPDLLILLAQWLQVFFEENLNQTQMWPVMIILRGARVLRLLRLVQLLKVQVILHEIGTRFRSYTNVAMVGVLKFIVASAISIHFSSCIWYGIGRSRMDGWVYTERLENASIFRSYMTSLYWTLSQSLGNSSFHPGNLQEFGFAIVVMTQGLFVVCYLVGAITHMMMQTDIMHSNNLRQKRLLCGYLKRHGISSALSIRARVHFESKSRQKQEEQAEEDQTKAVLAVLPQSLQLDIAEEINGPVLMSYSFLSDIKEDNPHIVRHLCQEALTELSVPAGEVVFHSGDVSQRMLFIMTGGACYTLLRRPCCSRSKGLAALQSPQSPLSNGSLVPAGFFNEAIAEIDSDQDESVKRADHEDGNLLQLPGTLTTTSFSRESSPKRMRSRSPSDGNISSIPLNAGDIVSEAALWTTWECCGELGALSSLTVLALEASSFAAVIARNIAAHRYATRYARLFVKRINNAGECSDVLRFHLVRSAVESEPLTRAEDGVRTSSKSMASLMRNMRLMEPISADAQCHFMFISHHKAEAGTEATLMQEALERMIHADARSSGIWMKAPVFLDSEDLSDLSQLKEHVMKSRNLVLLLTKEVLERPWVLVEIVTASQHGLNIVPVEVQKKDMSFDYPEEVFFSKILDGTAFPEDAIRLLANEGINLDEVEKTLRKVFKKIAVPFSPHKSANVRDAELRDILRRCQDAAIDIS